MITNPCSIFLIKLGPLIGVWSSYMWGGQHINSWKMLYFRFIQIVQKIVSLHLVLYSM